MSIETTGYSPETDEQIIPTVEAGRVIEIQDGQTRLETELRKDGAVMAMLLYLGKDMERIPLTEIKRLLGPRWSIDEVRKILEVHNFKIVPKYKEEEKYIKLNNQISAIEKEIKSLNKRQSQRKMRMTKELNELKKRLKKFSLEASGIPELSESLRTGELEVYQYDTRLIGKWQTEVKRDDDRIIELVREHILEATPGELKLNLDGPFTEEQLAAMDTVKAVADPGPGEGDDEEGYWD